MENSIELSRSPSASETLSGIHIGRHGARLPDAPVDGSDISGAAHPCPFDSYPKELEETVVFKCRPILLRPIRPEDLPQHQAFIARVSPEDMQTRFFHSVRILAPEDLARFTHPDYERTMAFIAVGRNEQGLPETLGVVRAHADPENYSAEFAILVRSDLKGQGLGTILLQKMIRYCRSQGLRQLVGDVLAVNAPMLRLASKCGFRAKGSRSDCVRVMLDL